MDLEGHLGSERTEGRGLDRGEGQADLLPPGWAGPTGLGYPLQLIGSPTPSAPLWGLDGRAGAMAWGGARETRLSNRESSSKGKPSMLYVSWKGRSRGAAAAVNPVKLTSPHTRSPQILSRLSSRDRQRLSPDGSRLPKGLCFACERRG